MSVEDAPRPNPVEDPVGFRDAWAQCPLYEADDKLGEAAHFLREMADSYHEPDHFRWNLNAFIQALRSVTFLVQSQLADRTGFSDWYSRQREAMRADPLLRRFVEGRNLVVKQRNLYFKSTVKAGYFRYRKPRQWIEMEISPHLPSKALFPKAAELGLVDGDHAVEGEEYGVQREWVVEELGPENALDLCSEAWLRIGAVLDAAHGFAGVESRGGKLEGLRSADWSVLTESDADPSLLEKWGWV